MDNPSHRKDSPHCNSLIANHKAPKTTKICTIKPFIITKIHNIIVFCGTSSEKCKQIGSN